LTEAYVVDRRPTGKRETNVSFEVGLTITGPVVANSGGGWYTLCQSAARTMGTVSDHSLTVFSGGACLYVKMKGR